MSLNINLESEKEIFNFILNTDLKEDKFLEIVDIIEKKVTKRINNKKLTNIINNYRQFNIDLTWINEDYKKLVIEQTTQDLINDKIIFYYLNK